MDDRPIMLINGAGSPLGQALARHCAEHYRLALYDANSHHCRQLAQQLHLKQYSALALTVDRNLDGQIAEHVIARLQHRWHGLDILINLPGSITAGPFLTLGHERWQQQWQRQFLEPVQWCQAALTPMQQQRRGLILNGYLPLDLVPPTLNSLQHSLAQAVISLSESLNEEYQPHGIRVLAQAVNPGNQEQPLEILASDPLSKARLQRSLATHPLTLEQQHQQIIQRVEHYRHQGLPDNLPLGNWRRWLSGGKQRLKQALPRKPGTDKSG